MWGFFDETNLPPRENKIYFNKICQKHFPMAGGGKIIKLWKIPNVICQ